MDSRAPKPPEIVGYEFIRFINKGGFADVHLYRQNAVNREVAVKVLRGHDLSAANTDAFRDEAQMMAAVRHRHIVTIYDFGVAEDGRPYIVMEYCPEHMGDVVRRRPLRTDRALTVALEIAGAVDTLHGPPGGDPIIHRDIKPANVLVRENGEPALTDFGIAGTLSRISQGSVGLSVPYAPPEVLRGIPSDGVRADVYSLAATIYALFAGRSPFEVVGGDNSEDAFIRRILSDAVPPIGRADVPAVVDGMLRRALDKTPDARFRSAAELARSLQRIETELGFRSTPFEGVGSTRSQPIRIDDTEQTRRPERTADEESTRVAARHSTGAKPKRSAPLEPEISAPNRSKTRGTQGFGQRGARLPIAIGVVVIVVAILTIVIGSRSDNGDVAEIENSLPTPTVEFEFGQTPPSPSDIQVDRVAGGIEVSWSGADAEVGDSYLVQVAEGAFAGPAAITTETSFRIDDVPADEALCVTVRRERGGVSSEPRDPTCAPPGSDV